ncbi:hypothetical protein NW759_006476 [Fusarium solani]|nr:hypothetical protein NW759_006476 [Fusarium solani]
MKGREPEATDGICVTAIGVVCYLTTQWQSYLVSITHGQRSQHGARSRMFACAHGRRAAGGLSPQWTTGLVNKRRWIGSPHPRICYQKASAARGAPPRSQELIMTRGSYRSRQGMNSPPPCPSSPGPFQDRFTEVNTLGLGGHVLHTRHSHLSRPQNSETREDRTGQETPQTRYLGCAQSEHELLRRYPTATWSHTSSVAASHMAMMASSHAHGGICSNSKPMHDAIIYVLLFLGCLRSPGLTQKRRMSAHSPARTHAHGHTRTVRETRNLVGFSPPPVCQVPGLHRDPLARHHQI